MTWGWEVAQFAAIVATYRHLLHLLPLTTNSEEIRQKNMSKEHLAAPRLFIDPLKKSKISERGNLAASWVREFRACCCCLLRSTRQHLVRSQAVTQPQPQVNDVVGISDRKLRSLSRGPLRLEHHNHTPALCNTGH